MFEKAKAAAKAGADSAERAAKQTKLKADILLIENKLKTLKMEFGKDVYPAMAAGDRQTTETLFMTTKGKVEAMEAEIAQKKAEIETLKTPGNSNAPPVGPPPGGMAPPVGPPPGGPPPGEPALPPGWKSTPHPPPRSLLGTHPMPRRCDGTAPLPPLPSPTLPCASGLLTGRPPISCHASPPAEATTPEGKDYYYDSNGATSWTFPTG
jgi:hypothetical protein